MSDIPQTYTVRRLPGLAWAVMKDGKSKCVCDREADAERIAYCLHVVEQSEETARKDGQA